MASLKYLNTAPPSLSARLPSLLFGGAYRKRDIASNHGLTRLERDRLFSRQEVTLSVAAEYVLVRGFITRPFPGPHRAKASNRRYNVRLVVP